ncbi:MAG: hypothetical protein HQ564_09460 [Candidatus Saganbacteria bacterium]|nr:hypothetical protein [Candidatus Saganbacteria bacterium]
MKKKKIRDKLGAMAEKALKEAVKKALVFHARMGVPAVFAKEGKLQYLLPDGRIVSKAPKLRKNR